MKTGHSISKHTKEVRNYFKKQKKVEKYLSTYFLRNIDLVLKRNLTKIYYIKEYSK